MRYSKSFIFFILYIFGICETSKLDRNMLLIIADDAGFEMGAYGNRVIQTPNLDGLASRSLIFNRARTSVSSCSPSRAALLTGLPSHQNGLYGLHHDVHHYDSFSTVQSLPGILNKAAIRTGIIGKKHVGPPSAYQFDFEETEENNPLNQVGRNITRIKLLVRQFLSQHKNNTNPFFLYVAFHDPHRCDHSNPNFGHFCEKFGDGSGPHNLIPDWTPVHYTPDQVRLPGRFVPDTPAARLDLAAQYTAISRLDQGIGLVLEELRLAGKADSTLVMYSSDNGISFPNGRTNLYEPGVAVPLLIRSPFQNESLRGHIIDDPASLLDIVPTVLDWFDLTYPDYHILKPDRPTRLLGRSLLPLLKNKDDDQQIRNASFYGSHITHEVTMNYPMRSIVDSRGRFKLIHNLNYRSPFPIDQDFYMSPTFLDILNRTEEGRPLRWTKSLNEYYFRDEWELYDIFSDPDELTNLHRKKKYKEIFDELEGALSQWQKETYDPWLCAPHGVLLDVGRPATDPLCAPLFNRHK